jgi:hypothetical protein
VPYKGPDGAGVGGRAEGEEQEWKIESCTVDVSNAAWLLKTHEGLRAADAGIDVIPRALSSSVQSLINSWTSSGSTVLRVQASSHTSLTGAASASCWPFFFLESLLLKREKMLGILASQGGFNGDERVEREAFGRKQIFQGKRRLGGSIAAGGVARKEGILWYWDGQKQKIRKGFGPRAEGKRVGIFFGVGGPSSCLQPSSVALQVGIERLRIENRESTRKGRVLGEVEDGWVRTREEEKGVRPEMLAMSGRRLSPSRASREIALMMV